MDRYLDDQPACKTIISAEDIRLMKAKVRRQEDIRNGVGINRRYTVSANKKRQQNRTKCRKPINLAE